MTRFRDYTRKLLQQTERESESDSDALPMMTLAEVFDDDLTTERVNENVIRIIEIDELRQG